MEGSVFLFINLAFKISDPNMAKSKRGYWYVS